MKRVKYRKLNAVQCLKCKEVLISYTVHDFNACRCGSVYVDGGFDYQRLGFNDRSLIREMDFYEKAAK